MPEPMTPERCREFLATGSLSAVLAAVRPDGRPHATPLWYGLDGDDVLISIGADTVKGRAIAAEPRVTLCVHEDKPPYSFVMVEGTAGIVTDPDDMRHIATEVGRRYVPAEALDGYVAYQTSPGKVGVRIRVDHLVGVDSVAG
jgi:PPOX class probable F420-dependent enzyme